VVNVRGTDLAAGGLAGRNFGSITTNYITGKVSGNENVGGLVGSNPGNLSNCYSTCMVSGTGARVGGLVGSGGGSKSFWDIETSGQTTSAGGTGLTTAEMMDPEMLGLNGLANNPNWILDAYSDYPHLACEGTIGDIIPWPVIHWLDGNGTVESPYEIVTVGQLSRLSRGGALSDRHFILVNDLDLSGLSWSQAVIPYFTGCFDGNGFMLHHFHIQGTNDMGLIGHLGRDAIITNIGLKDVSIEGTDNVGSLVGRNNGTISNSYSTGTITGEEDVGGLVGSNGMWDLDCGHVTHCYSTATISGTERAVGGLVGFNFGNVSQCYSTGKVNGSRQGGGIIGSGWTSYVTDCFWDIETSGQTISDGGTGKTTVEMQIASTFLEASWDFVDETANGTKDIWWILEGQSYPRLWWQYDLAFSPYPQNGAIDVIQPIILNWLRGGSGLYHEVYFGEDEEAVANATTKSKGIYRGQLPVEVTTYDLGKLELYKTYYWRIDEVNEADLNNFWKGNIWSFTTSNFLVVDNIEGYNERIFDFWIDGWGTPTNGSTVSILGDIDPYFNPDLWGFNVPGVHGGEWSMAYF